MRSLAALAHHAGAMWRSFVFGLSGKEICWEGGSVGKRVTVRVTVRVTDGGMFRAGTNLALADDCKIIVQTGQLSVGNSAFLGWGTVITCRQHITIGDHVLIAEYVTIRDQDHCFGGPAPTAQNGFATAPITIGHNVWIGAKATITKGVTIGDNSVVAAGAVVVADVPPNCVVGGVPARVLKAIDG